MSTPTQGGPRAPAPRDRTHRRGTPPQSWGPPPLEPASGHGHPQQSQQPQQPSRYGHPQQAPGYTQPPPAKKPWALISVAAGCILALLLGIGGGITYLALSGGEEPTAGGTTPPQQSTTPSESPGATASPTPTTELPTYEVIAPIDDVEGSADDVWAILSAYPLTEGTMGAQQEDPAEVPTMYLWDMSLNYIDGIAWKTSLWPYYRALDEKLEDDPERQEETNRRYSLQQLCLASAASMRAPEASQPSQEARDILSSEEHRTPAEGKTTSIAPSSRAHWVKQGLESEGDLTRCNTWTAPAEQLA